MSIQFCTVALLIWKSSFDPTHLPIPNVLNSHSDPLAHSTTPNTVVVQTVFNFSKWMPNYGFTWRQHAGRNDSVCNRFWCRSIAVKPVRFWLTLRCYIIMNCPFIWLFVKMDFWRASYYKHILFSLFWQDIPLQTLSTQASIARHWRLRLRTCFLTFLYCSFWN